MFINREMFAYAMTDTHIPDHDNLEFRVKALNNKSSALTLSAGESALYIGSGPELQNVWHMLPLVDAPHYILSDLAFPARKTTRYNDCSITQTNQDGFHLVSEDPAIRFVMIDQAAEGDFERAYNAMHIGTVIYIHTIDTLHPHISRVYQERIGATALLSKCFFKKERNAGANDFAIAREVHNIITSPLLAVPYLSDDSMPGIFANVVRRRCFGDKDDDYSRQFAHLEADMRLHGARDRFREDPTPEDLARSQALFETLLEPNGPLELSFPDNPFTPGGMDSKKILAEADAVRKIIDSVSPRLIPSERDSLRDVLTTCSSHLVLKPEIAYCRDTKAIIDRILAKL